MRLRGRCATLAGLALMLLACAGDALPKPETIGIAGGDGQQAPAGARLSVPLTVIVRGEDGTPFTRGRVRWSLVERTTGAMLSDSVTLSDGLGRAEAVLTLGATAGAHRVTAVLVERTEQRVTFSATATEPPALTSISPTSFRSGETITVVGQGLRMGLTALIGGVPAAVSNVSATGQGFDAVVPSCLPPGVVDVRAVVDGAQSNAVAGTYVASGGAVSLAPGEYVSMTLEALGDCAQFPGGPAEYLFVVQSGSGEPGTRGDYRFQGDSTAPIAAPSTGAPDPSVPFAVRFHDRLREQEAVIAGLPKPYAPQAAPGASLATINVGDEREFRVCSKVDCSAAADFPKIVAVARYVGAHAAIFVDEDAPTDGLSDADLSALGGTFDEDLYELATRTFGVESDVDRNGHVIILMTPVVNRLTPESQCETSIISGFFFSLDIDPAFRDDVRSNRGEVFYTIVADPSGSITCSHPTDRIRRLVPVTFIHEFQHMINYNQHVLLRGAGTEFLWLNEGLSHLAEEIGGLHFLALGNQQRFSQFAIGDLFDAYQYLTAPGMNFLVFKEGTGTLAERGAAWLFLRWMVDQYGDGLPRRLVETSRRGAANIEAATGGTVGRLVSEWALANYVSDLPDFATPARLRYAGWKFRETYQSLHDQAPERFPRAYPLEPLVVVGGEVDVTGTLRAGSGDHFLVQMGSEHGGFALTLSRPDGGALASALAARLNVIRIR